MPDQNPEPLQAEAIIDLDAIRANAAAIKSRTSAEMMAVVKADGYGHGLVPAARAVLAGGASRLGVCTLAEAYALRSAEISAPILAWLIASNQPLAPALQADVELSAASEQFLSHIVAAARQTGITAKVHLKLDTGLGRNGAPVSAWPGLLTAAAKAQADGAIEITGIWSHFAIADDPGHPSIAAQQVVFDEGLDAAARLGIRPQLRHLANSAASLTAPNTHYDLIRPGIALYGLCPMEGREAEFGLTPAMTLRGQVLLTKRVPAGHGVSYGLTYTTQYETTLALIGLGYADGVSRAASSAGPVQLGGVRRRIAGRVCMDQFVIDVGDDPIKVGDVATLFGPGLEGEPTANDWSALLGTINYEIVTTIGGRVSRTYRPLKVTDG